MDILHLFFEKGKKYSNSTFEYPQKSITKRVYNDKEGFFEEIELQVNDYDAIANIFGCNEVFVVNYSQSNWGGGEWFFVTKEQVLDSNVSEKHIKNVTIEPLMSGENITINWCGFVRGDNWKD